MSCSHQINTYTNSKYIYRGVSRFRQSFACGRCDSCVRRIRNEWRLRAYYESNACLSRTGSFILFDTLTYSDDYIRKYSDIFPELHIPALFDKTCFSRRDVQLFFKRLRVNLTRAGYRIKNGALRYILTSEYGSSEKTRGFLNTHRPHYHILFFVSFPINPIEFSRFVSRSWLFGKTDGVRPFDDCKDCPLKSYCRGNCLYQTSQYVINERVISRSTTANLLKCVNYVTKYVSKDMFVSKILEDRVAKLWSFLLSAVSPDLFDYRLYRRFLLQVLPFHIQSLGFGLSFLDDSKELDFALSTGKVRMPTSDSSVMVAVALPRYYRRKLFYEHRVVDGRVVWSLTPFGIDYKLKELERNIDNFISDYHAFDNSFPSQRLYDLALYNCVYRGTLSDYQSLLLPYWEYYRRLLSPHSDDEIPLYYNRNTVKDKFTVGRFLSTRYSVTQDGEIIYHGKQLHREFIPYDGYVIVDDKVCSFWHGFDFLLMRFFRWKNGLGFVRDVLQSQKDANLDYYKTVGMLKC